MLDSEKSFILETYNKLHVWQGKNASINEKRSSMTLAAKYKKEWNKPTGTSISRIPEGTEDAMFRSYFEGFYANEQPPEFKQDITALANKQLKAASLLMGQLGSNYTVSVYWVKGHEIEGLEKIEDAYEMGKFFSGECYVVDVKGESHRYFIVWDGYNMPSPAHSKVTELITSQLCGGLLESNQSQSRVSACQEGEDFLQFFPNGFAVLMGQRKPMAELDEQLK